MNRRSCLYIVTFLIVLSPLYLVCSLARKQALNVHLIAAVKSNDNAEVAELLAGGADANAYDTKKPLGFYDFLQNWFHGHKTTTNHNPKVTALILAVQINNLVAAERLLAAGADVNARDSMANTPLLVASHIGSSAMVQLLLAHRANVNAANLQGENPMIAVCGDKFGPPAGQGMFEVYAKDFIHTEDRRVAARLLLENGANVNAQTHSGYTPLRQAVEHDDVKLVKMLLAHHADIGCDGDRHYRGETLLDNAKPSNVSPMRDLLIQAGAKSSDSP